MFMGAGGAVAWWKRQQCAHNDEASEDIPLYAKRPSTYRGVELGHCIGEMVAEECIF